jgi:cytochrome P450 PksS
MGFDLQSPTMHRDPYPAYANMRQQSHVPLVDHAFTGANLPFIARYADALVVMKDPRFVSDQRKLPTGADWTKKWYIPSVIRSLTNSMVLLDEPDHTRLRGLVHRVFTPAMIQAMTTTMEQLTHRLLDEAARKPRVDLVEDLALALPLTVIGDMIGLPQADRANFRRWVKHSVSSASPKKPVDALGKVINAFRLEGLLRKLVTERKRNPQDDLVSRLAQAEEAGDRLSEDELMSMLFLILFAGHETTVNLISSGTLTLLQHPDQLALLKANPALMDSAIEELLRYTNPVQTPGPRYALEEAELSVGRIPQYSAVIVGLASANRDPDAFPNPDVLDITRNPNRHIAFGFGIHYCLGAPLARLETKVALTALLERFPNLQLAIAPDQIHYQGLPSFYGPVSLPIRLQ